jgi:uncharacterized protein
MKISSLFILITFIIMLLTWGVLAIIETPLLNTTFGMFLYILGGTSPTFAAFYILMRSKGKQKKNYLKVFFSLNFKFYFVFAIIILMTIFVIFPYILNEVFYPLSDYSFQPIYMMIPFFLIMVLMGGIEEFGWRGVLLENHKNQNPILVSLMIGMIWSLWHLPLFFISGSGYNALTIIPFFISTIAFSFLLHGIYLKTNNVLLCVIGHALVNAYAALGFIQNSDLTAAFIDSIGRLIVGVVVFYILVYGVQRKIVTK